jgi:hypothetical protein
LSNRRWKLVYLTQGAPYTELHRSRAALYRAVEAERERIAAGFSRVTGMSAYQWDADLNDWRLHERLTTA